MSRSPRCPSCGSPRVLPVLWGMPTPEMSTADVIIGGCIVTDNSPLWRCQECGRGWGRFAEPELAWNRALDRAARARSR